jgi:RimJ/RimL family protein N-acetyltransferase
MILRTRRLLLREFQDTDWPAVLAYQADPRYLRYNHWTERTEESVRVFVQMFLDWQQETPRSKYQLALVLPAEDRVIGNCGIRMPRAGSREAELGYELDPIYWGQGYATEAARAIVTFGFEQLHLHRVMARCIADNVGSVRVLEKLGMQREGHLREHEWFKNRWWDTLIYGLLDREWQAQSAN